VAAGTVTCTGLSLLLVPLSFFWGLFNKPSMSLKNFPSSHGFVCKISYAAACFYFGVKLVHLVKSVGSLII
jgi:hypothetical protein